MDSGKKLTQALSKPIREADYVSERGIEYWWSPEWVRNLNGTICRIKPIKRGEDVGLYMMSKAGNVSFIKGRIQQAFKQWHLDRAIDYTLLGVPEEEIIANDW